MSTHLHVMPVDRTKIQTRVRIHPGLFDDPGSFIRKQDLPIRTSKLSRGTCKRGPTQNLSLDVLTYKGIKLKLRKVTDDPLTDATIHLNPGVCLRAHNGAVPSLSNFLDALALVCTHLKPLLEDPKDWVDLIPGLRSKGVAYWSYLEVFLHCVDTDGALLRGFRNAQGKTGNTPVRHWSESMVIGGKDSDLKFGIYRKAVEMVAHDKLPPDDLPNYRHILRLEVRLKGRKLVDYLGDERNIEEIDGAMRLVRFYPQDLAAGHRCCFSELHGVFHPGDSGAGVEPPDQLTALGRLLARVSLDPRSPHTLAMLLYQLRFYTGATTDTIGPIRKAGLEEVSRRSLISDEELFSHDAYGKMLDVRSVEREQHVACQIDGTLDRRLIANAYRPQGQPHRLRTQWPSGLLP